MSDISRDQLFEDLADALGEADFAYNVADLSDEVTTVIRRGTGVETVAEHLAGHKVIAELLAHIDAQAAQLDAVKALHPPVTVYEFDVMNGVFKTDADGEQIEMATLCRTCTDSSVISDIEDCEYDPSYSDVNWPCPTIKALEATDGR